MRRAVNYVARYTGPILGVVIYGACALTLALAWTGRLGTQ